MNRTIKRFITVCLLLAIFASALAPARQNREGRQDVVINVDDETLADVRQFYPETTLRDDGARPYFRTIDLVDEFVLGDQPYRIVWVSRGRVRQPHTLVLDSAGRVLRQDWGFLRSELALVDERWLRYRDYPLVNLNDSASFEHFLRYGHGAILRHLVLKRVHDAIGVYFRKGRQAFLEQAPIRAHREKHVHLPERVWAVGIYPSLVEDFRPSLFKYSTPWEATVFVRLFPVREDETPITLEISASGWAEGIEAADVDLRLWKTVSEEPIARPASEPLELPR